MNENRLARESSPYLRQHAANPVDWFPWGDEAIAKARAERKPLFVSVGYSTCYWCHVMERESFESAAIAEQLSRDFVSVKVDREERPDVDDAMMAACQVYTSWSEGRSSGGWPLTAFLDPDSLHPFFAGTYFPPTPAHGRVSFTQLLTHVATAWREKPDVLRAQAEKLFDAMRTQIDGAASAPSIDMPLVELASRCAVGLLEYEDATHGGFGGAPKFPQPMWLELWSELALDEPRCAQALTRALRAMTLGGIHDHLGGGFHRYSVDAQWRVPHFEKMLYDSAQLVPLLACADDPWLKRAAARALAWMRREMKRDDELFHAALDAEVQGHEGLNYLWTPHEMRAALSEGDAHWATKCFGLDAGTNFKDPHQPSSAPTNVLFLAEIPARADWPQLDRASDLLLAARRKREQPRTDTKAILAWNALAIRAFAIAGAANAHSADVEQAARSFAAAWKHFVEVDTRDERVARVWRVRRDGLDSYAAQLEDVALLAHAACALHDATDDAMYAHDGWRLVDYAVGVHCDEDSRWCERAGRDEWGLRGRSLQDGAVAGGAGTMTLVLARLAQGGARSVEARTLLTRSLRAARGACVETPMEAARTLVAAHRAAALLWPECVESVVVRRMSTGGDQNAASTVEIELVASAAWHLSAQESAVLSVVSAEGSTLRLRVHDASAPTLSITLVPCTTTHCLAPITLELCLA